jgi:hypothetical protein
MRDPPRNGIPSDDSVLSVEEFVAEITRIVADRNNTGIEWATLTEEIQEGDEADS